MMKEIQDLRRSIHYSAISVVLISITLMVAVMSLAFTIFILVKHSHLLPDEEKPREDEPVTINQ